jgi:RNA polymerase sigma-70 factor (ECF subfamily)
MSRDPDTDPDDLLRLARSEGGATLGRLLEGYRAYLTALVRRRIDRRLRSKVDAADLVQEVFLKASRDFPRFRGQSRQELRRWLRRILATTAAMESRRFYRSGRDVRLECELPDEFDTFGRLLRGKRSDAPLSPGEQAALRDQDALLRRAMGRLPQDYRRVLQMRHLEGLRFPEVARRLNRSIDSVKKLWMRALARLREDMEGQS